MQKYQILSKAGSGNFSEVYKARNCLTDEIVAIKEMKHCEDLEQLTYKELQILATLNHPNIIKVKEVLRQKGDVKVVFEYMDESLLELYQSCKYGINQNQIKCILFQTAFALDYFHKRRLIHRDIKPQNLLINRKLALVKLIDFGLAKEDYLASTDYVATRWYRAPENLLGLKNSSTAMDIFALGCVIVELFTLNPLFPGDNTVDQLHKIINILGTPTMQNWPEGYKQIQKKGMNLPSKPPMSLRFCMPTASSQLIDLVENMIQLNPVNRLNARQIMQHPFFEKVERVIPEHIYKQAVKARQQYEAKKARKIEPNNFSPLYEQNGFHSFFSKASMKSMKAIKTNELNGKDSRVSIQNKPSMKESKKPLATEPNLKAPSKNLDFKKPSLNLNIYPNIKTITPTIVQRIDQDPRARCFFSRDHYTPASPLSAEKRSPYENNLVMMVNNHYVTKTLGDEVKPTGKAALESKKSREQDGSVPSPRYKVKYFKQPTREVNKTNANRNAGISLESGHISKNRTIGNERYIPNPRIHKNFRKDYL